MGGYLECGCASDLLALPLALIDQLELLRLLPMPLALLLPEALEGLGRARVDPEQRQDVAQQVELRAQLRQLRAPNTARQSDEKTQLSTG